MSTFQSVCPTEVLNSFKNTDYYPTDLRLSRALNTTIWGRITNVDSFILAMNNPPPATANAEFVTKSIPIAASVLNNQVSSNYTLNFFSVLKILRSITGQTERYRDPDAGYWSARGVTNLSDSTLSALYTKLTTMNIPGKQADDFIIKTMSFTGAQMRYSVTLDFLYSIQYEY